MALFITPDVTFSVSLEETAVGVFKIVPPKRGDVVFHLRTLTEKVACEHRNAVMGLDLGGLRELLVVGSRSCPQLLERIEGVEPNAIIHLHPNALVTLMRAIRERGGIDKATEGNFASVARPSSSATGNPATSATASPTDPACASAGDATQRPPTPSSATP